MSMWQKQLTLAQINQLNDHTLVDHLGIEFTRIDDYGLEATMPVDHRTKQAAGLLHGGASVALAESIGSIASYLCMKTNDARCVGIEINANHLRSMTTGMVTGRATALRIGRRIHVWEIRITNANHEMVCISRLTVTVSEGESTVVG